VFPWNGPKRSRKSPADSNRAAFEIAAQAIAIVDYL